jgi:C-terminal processing protease CtpA/Prc
MPVGLVMRKSCLMSFLLLLAGCGSSSGGDRVPQVAENACSNQSQKQFVVDSAREWYLWNDRLPASVDLAAFATPNDVMAHLMTFSPAGSNGGPVDRFSGVGSAAADQQFFGEGQYEGFGFSPRLEPPDDLRLERVFADSPAGAAGLERGQRILRLDGRTIAEIEAAEGVFAVFDRPTVEFTIEDTDGTEFVAPITQGIVTIDPVPQWRLIPRAGTVPVGYFEFAQFISTADAVFDTVFAQFAANDVTDVIIDLRYNGGGVVTTANLLGDYLGGRVAENLLFSETRFNADRAANNVLEFFGRLGNSISLSRLVIIASAGTASASELIANGLAPHVEVVIVGDTTFGKPIGQAGFEFCGNILRITAFQIFNADGYGDYFDGLPVDCPAPDDLDVAVGADADPNVVAAMTYLDTGACPAAAGDGMAKPNRAAFVRRPEPDGRPARDLGGAF